MHSAEAAVLIVAGEVSGDMHAGRLAASVRQRRPGLTFFGIGGYRMREAGVETQYDVHDMAVTGITEALRKLPFLRRVFLETVAAARERRPAAAILIDYPGFNLRLAARLHAMGIKTLYYICPQVWAWHRARISRMARNVDRLITILPFEKECFDGTGPPVDFVGHPLVDEVRQPDRADAGPLPWNAGLRIALLPGSRDHEVQALLPTMWAAAGLLQRKHPEAGFLIAAPSARVEALAKHLVSGRAGGPSRCAVVAGRTRRIMRESRAALIASGTATLEASLLLCPAVITYKVSGLTYLAGRLLVRVPYLGLVNIVAGHEVCPELLQGRATPAALAASLEPLLGDTPRRAAMLRDMREANRTLGPGGAVERAADIVARELPL